MITKLRFFFTLMLLFVGIGSALAQDETFDLTKGYSNGDPVTEVKGTNVTLTFAKGGEYNTAPAWYTDEGTAVRLYRGNTMKVAANDANNVIQKVVITCVSNDFAPTESTVRKIADNGTCARSIVNKQPTVTWTGNSNSVTFTNPTPDQWHIQKVVVTYAAAGTATKKKTTTVTFPKSNFTFTQNSTEASSFKGQKATVTASDGTVLSDAALTYTVSPESLATVDKDGTVALDETKVGVVTVTATYAGNDNYYGSSASYAITIKPKTIGDGTEANPYTVADIILMNRKNTLPTEEVYVKGTITTKTMKYYANSKSIDYYISDNGKTTKQIEVYRGKGLNGADFSARADLKARSTVIVKGKPLYKSQNLEINSGSQIVCLNGHYDAVNVTSAGYATYVTRHAIDMSNDTEVKAYAVSYDQTNDVIKLKQVTEAPANTALVFQATEGKHMLTEGNSTTALTDNDLTFYTTDTEVTTDHSVLILAQNSKREVGFHPVKVNTTVAAYKGILKINSTSSTKTFYGLNDDATTGIGHVSASTASNGVRYNLAGQRVNANFKGVIIVNGKKFIQK